jgi:hypothetical protein
VPWYPDLPSGGPHDEFRTIGKLWPSGSEVDLGTDSNVLGGPATFTRNAAPFVTSPDGTQNYQFLFWNTGRHMTNKRRVRWNFSVLGWGTWTATRWYGTPSGGGGGSPRVRADSFSIGTDGSLAGPTPIDGTASTFAAGAWPFGGDDHAIGTAAGPASVVAKDPLNSYQFAGWLPLIWGGDPSGEFVESDAGTGGVIGGAGFYDHVVGGAFAAPAGTSADLLATYGEYHRELPGGLGPYVDWWERFGRQGRGPGDFQPNVDPSPIDLIRIRVLEQLMRQMDSDPAAGTDFRRLIDAAPTMSRDELKRTMQSLQTTLELGKAALTAIEAQMKRSPK